MKGKFLATTAIAIIAMAGAASAQSVLERVLGEIDNATNLSPVNGTFANIAENLGGAGSITTFSADLTDDQAAALGLGAGPTAGADTYTLTQSQLDSLVTKDEYTTVPAGAAINTTTGEVISAAAYGALSAADKLAFRENATAADEFFAPGNIAGQTPKVAADMADVVALGDFTAETVTSGLGIAGIDGSINNTIDGITDSTQNAVAGVVSATEYNMPQFDFGGMATTALGAVNTGDITIGVNANVDDAKTSTTQAVSTVMTQLGGDAGTGAIMLNIASNMTGVDGSINNLISEVNGKTGDLATTALGAVNTGTIISGVNSAVNGITGMGGTDAASVAAANGADNSGS